MGWGDCGWGERQTVMGEHGRSGGGVLGSHGAELSTNRRDAWCAGAEESTVFRRVFGRGWQRHATSRWGGCWVDWGWGL